jgi:exopolysaccharide/PEP-CTERM locus tyrosine autokinase
MSRIEQALEKTAAARNRQTAPVAPINPAPGKEPAAGPSMDALLKTPPLQINNPMLAAMYDNHDAASEEYNKLRSRIITLTQGDEFYNTLMVTSTIGEEGKTLTALNLAISMAKGYDHTVLLVDADLRRPSLHRVLNLKPKVGLIQCLTEKVPVSEALIKTGIGKLVVLPAGGSIDNPVELLASNQMKELIVELKNRYPERYVIFDTPPILPFADAQVLAPEVDGTVFVVREGKAKSKDVKEAIRSLHDTNIFGVVYNDVRLYSRRPSYYYYYNHHHE